MNPLTVESQFQAGVAFGLSQLMAKGAITLKDGLVEQRNFDGYVPPYMPDAPVAVDVHIVPSTETPYRMRRAAGSGDLSCGSQCADQTDRETLSQPAARHHLTASRFCSVDSNTSSMSNYGKLFHVSGYAGTLPVS